jgi:endonuclease YncB( thermonuclease family)
LLIAFAQARAEVVEVRVTHIGDGDSLSVCLAGHEARVRLLYIDAPEYRQSFGKEARRSLAELCEHTVARLEWEKLDRYGRMLATVACRGVDANLEQVRRGMAWVSALDAPHESFYAAQRSARQGALGLWSEPQPEPPWQWRRGQAARSKATSGTSWPGRTGRECSP